MESWTRRVIRNRKKIIDWNWYPPDSVRRALRLRMSEPATETGRGD